MIKSALTIAGFDPCSSAGVTLDIRIFEAFGLYPLSLITAITDQSSKKIYDLKPVDPDFISNQLKHIIADTKVNYFKIGLTPNPEIIKTIAENLKTLKEKFIVLDPVIVSSSGYQIMDGKALDSLKDLLLPISDIVTPNMNEASILSGIKISGIDSLKKAAEKIKLSGIKNIVITGVDIKTDHETFNEFIMKNDGSCSLIEKQKLPIDTPHGTGCSFSSALLAIMKTKNISIDEAVKESSTYLSFLIKNSIKTKEGKRVLNLNLKK